MYWAMTASFAVRDFLPGNQPTNGRAGIDSPRRSEIRIRRTRLIRSSASDGPLRQRAQRADRGGRVRRLVHRRAGHEHVRTGLRAPADSLLADSPVHLQPHRGAAARDDPPGPADLVQHEVEEVLAAVPG